MIGLSGCSGVAAWRRGRASVRFGCRGRRAGATRRRATALHADVLVVAQVLREIARARHERDSAGAGARFSHRSSRSASAAAIAAFDCSGSDSSPSSLMIVTALRLDLEPGIRARDVVGDDDVDALPAPLRARALDDVLGLGGKTDEQRRGRGLRGGARRPRPPGCPASAPASASAGRHRAQSSAPRRVCGV